LASPAASITSIYIGIGSWIDTATHRSELSSRRTHATISSYFELVSPRLTTTDCDLTASFGESSSIDHIYIHRDRLLDRYSDSRIKAELPVCTHAAITSYFEPVSRWLTTTDCDLTAWFGESNSINHVHMHRNRLLDRYSDSLIKADLSAYTCSYYPRFRICISTAHYNRLRPACIVWRVQQHQSRPYASKSALGLIQRLTDQS
jgi:hypothetical protein